MSLKHFSLRTHSRLHFGIFSDDRPGGAAFQGLGLTLQEPGFNLEFKQHKTPEIKIHGDPYWTIQTEKLLQKYKPHFLELPGFELSIHAAITPHTGLGSGTQFTLALLQSLCFLTNRNSLTNSQLLELSGRGQRSSIGSLGYFQPGFYVDPGHALTATEVKSKPRVLEFPSPWSLLLITARNFQGLHGQREQEAFASWPKFSPAELDQLHELSTNIIPQSIHDKDFDTFTTSLVKFGHLVGKSFAQFQGGIFSASYGQQLEQELQQLGFAGLVQSSWGPALALFLKDDNQKNLALNYLNQHPLSQQFEILHTSAATSGSTFIDHLI